MGSLPPEHGDRLPGLHSYILLSWMVILALTTGFEVGNLQDEEAIVYAEPSRLEIGAGQIETLRILLMNADKTYGIDLQAGFDPDVVEVVDADPGQIGIQMLPGGFLKPDFTVHNMADNQKGTLNYVVTQLKPTPSASGKGIILSVQFRGRTPGTSTKLTFTSAVIADRRGIKQPVTTRGADLIIVTSQNSTHTPRPTQTSIPPTPVLFASTLTRTRTQPSEPLSTATQPGKDQTVDITPSQPVMSVILDDPLEQAVLISNQEDSANLFMKDSAPADQILTYIAVGGFSAAFLLFGFTVWLLASQRRKNLSGIHSSGGVPISRKGAGNDPGLDDKERAGKSE